jgi:hypothetical protein
LDVLERNDGQIPLDGRTPYMDYDASGTDPERECLPAQTPYCIGLKWELPTSVGNEVQGDTLSFDLGFYTEQCRHNDGGSSTP